MLASFRIFFILTFFLVFSLWQHPAWVVDKVWIRNIETLCLLFADCLNFYIEELFVFFLLTWCFLFFCKRAVDRSFFLINFGFNYVSLFLCLAFFFRYVPYQLMLYFSSTGEVPFLPLENCFLFFFDFSGQNLFVTIGSFFFFYSGLVTFSVLFGYLKSFIIIIVCFAYFLALIEQHNFGTRRARWWDFLVILFSIFFFCSLIIISNDLFLFFLNLVGLNVGVYTLLVLDGKNGSTVEAAVKYFLLSTVSSLLILAGIWLTFGLWKTTVISNLHTLSYLLYKKFFTALLITSSDFYATGFNSLVGLPFLTGFLLSEVLNVYLCLISFIFVAGFLLKLSLFPFHFWAAEVYSVLSFKTLLIFTVLLKIVFFFKFVHIFFYGLNWTVSCAVVYTNYLILFSGVGSIFVGSITALVENKIRRLIAFSSTNQLGFVIISFFFSTYFFDNVDFLFNNTITFTISFLFMSIYLIGVFAMILILSVLSFFSKRFNYLSDLESADCLSTLGFFVIFLSFSGIPPFAGFFTKFYVLCYLWVLNLTLVSVFVVVLSVISCYYYLRLVKILGFDSPTVWLLRDKMFFLTQYCCKFFEKNFGSGWKLFIFFFKCTVVVLLLILLTFPIMSDFIFYIFDYVALMASGVFV